jgi:hypothetical protein
MSSELAERSLPALLPPISSPGRPAIRTTYQLAVTSPASAATIDAKFQSAIEAVLRWTKKKIPGQFPPQAWRGEGFAIQWPGQKVDCLAIPSQGLWTLRLEQPDLPFRGKPAVAGRVWTTDITVARQGDSLAVAVRSFCASLPQVREQVALTRPFVVIDLARSVGIADVRGIDGRPWTTESEADLAALCELLTHKDRTLPVVVLTQPDRRRLEVPVGDFVLDAEELAKRTIGLAHVVKIPWEIGYKWTEMVGKPWSVFLGAVRTYYPGLDFDNDQPALHPKTMAEQIVYWRSDDSQLFGEAAFAEFLANRLAHFSATKRVNWGPRVFVPEARTMLAALARRQATESSDWKELYEAEIEALKAKVEESQKEAEEYSDDAIEAARVRDYYVEENARLRYQNDALRASLARKTGESPDRSIPIPETYEELPEWAARHLAGRLVLHPRAIRAVKDAKYEDVQLVYRALLLLADEYRNCRMGVEKAKEAFEARLGELDLRCGGSISKERAGEEGDTYFVRFPPGNSPRRFLEFHLRKGTTKDDRYCLGIYFFWDEDSGQVVVGWLPSHLDNRMT